MNENIPSNGVIINLRDLSYQCSKDSPELLFGKMIIRDCRDKPCFPENKKLLSCQIKIKYCLGILSE